jgi:hypothetical protein
MTELNSPELDNATHANVYTTNQKIYLSHKLPYKPSHVTHYKTAGSPI